MGPGLRPRCAACRRSARSCPGACRPASSLGNPHKLKLPGKKTVTDGLKSPGKLKSSGNPKFPGKQKSSEKRRRFTEVVGRCDVCLRSTDSCNGDCEKKIESNVEKKILKKKESSPELELNMVIEQITRQRSINQKARGSAVLEAEVLARGEGPRKRNLVEVLGRSPTPRSSPSPTKAFFMKESTTTIPPLSFLPSPVSKQPSTSSTCSHSTVESQGEGASTPVGSWETAPLPPGFNQELGKFLKLAKFEAFKASNRSFADLSNMLV